MSPDQLRDRLLALRWSQRGLAEALRLHPTTVRRWAIGETRIPGNVGIWLNRLVIHHKQFPVPDGWFQHDGSAVPLADRGPVYREDPRDTDRGPVPVYAGVLRNEEG